MSDRQLRQRCERIVGSIDISEPIDVHTLSRLIGERQGRPIHLLPISLPVDTPCGLWVRTGTFDAVFYQADTSHLHQTLIISHEFGHILAGHGVSQTLDPDASRLLLPGLDPQLVARYLGRTNFSRSEEREAEIIASLLVTRIEASQRETERPLPSEAGDALGRLEASLVSHRQAKHG